MAPTAQAEKAVGELAREYFLSANSHDVDKMMEYWQPGGEAEIIGMATLRAPEGYHEFFGALFRAVPDYKFEILDVIAEGEKALVHWRGTGTFDGEGTFEGVAPTGTSLDMQGMDIVTIRDGLIQSIVAVVNGMDMARQMGVMPAAGSPAEKAMLGAANVKTAVADWIKQRRR